MTRKRIMRELKTPKNKIPINVSDIECIVLNNNTSNRLYGGFTDKLLLLKQANNVIILDKKGLQEIEKAVKGRFKS